MNLKVGMRVVVSAAATGDGINHKGFIDDIYEFARETFASVKFDEPTPWGQLGTVVNNLGMIEPES